MSRKRGKRREFTLFQGLSRPPEKPWPQGAAYHGARVGLLVALAGVITLLFPSSGRRAVTPLQLGDVAEEDVLAQIDFDIPKTPAELERERAEQEATVPPWFRFRPEARDSMSARLAEFFDGIQEAVNRGGRQAVVDFLEREDITNLGDEEVRHFLNAGDLQALRNASSAVAQELVPQLLDSNDAALITTGRIMVRYPTGEERQVPLEDLLWGFEFFNRALEGLGSPSPEMETVFRTVLVRFFESSFMRDQLATDAARDQAREAVPTIKGNVVAGEALVRRNQRIRDSDLELLNAHETALRNQGGLENLNQDWGSVLGSFLLSLLLLSIYGLLLFFFRQEVYGNFRWILLQFVLVLTFFLGAWVVAGQAFPPEFLPIVFAVLPVAVLWDGRMALVLALILSVLTGALPPFNEFYVMVLTLVGGGVAAVSARAIRRRSQTWAFIALISLGYALAILALGLMGMPGAGPGPLSLPYAAGNATLTALLAMGFMPVFEWFTGITTDQTLLEWADPNRPLLKRLSMEAGGTYAHTINVANLAESAATAIGANGLLARVGIYYHDVGKMLKPQYFVENQPGGRNPHDKLKAHTSAAIVREHVIEGLRMAREEGVPVVVARFIPEHHGTQLIGFFYERAKEESTEEPNPEEFRYPGPKPRSKETAIAMLADSVESATRALQDPSPERVRELVQTIVEGKIRDGQLSESPLTLREISTIQEQFVKV
ncbi:HD family phosphohydrolase, partial [Gemmatimonadota bacterium]